MKIIIFITIYFVSVDLYCQKETVFYKHNDAYEKLSFSQNEKVGAIVDISGNVIVFNKKKVIFTLIKVNNNSDCSQIQDICLNDNGEFLFILYNCDSFYKIDIYNTKLKTHIKLKTILINGSHYLQIFHINNNLILYGFNLVIISDWLYKANQITVPFFSAEDVVKSNNKSFYLIEHDGLILKYKNQKIDTFFKPSESSQIISVNNVRILCFNDGEIQLFEKNKNNEFKFIKSKKIKYNNEYTNTYPLKNRGLIKLTYLNQVKYKNKNIEIKKIYTEYVPILVNYKSKSFFYYQFDWGVYKFNLN